MDKQPLVKKPELTPKPPTFDAGFKCWGVCLTSFLTTFVVIGISDVFGVMLEVRIEMMIMCLILVII